VAPKDAQRPIVVVRRKKVVAAGHHGGSWKVAYADFVTAMMAFFMVMWILGMDDQTKQAIEGYFSNPVGYKKGYSAGANPLSSGNSPATVKRPAVRLIVRAYEQQRFGEVSKRLEERLQAAQGLLGAGTRVEVMLTEQGLRIELVEGGAGETFFPLASADIKPTGRLALELIAGELRGLANPVVIEGHTDAAPYGARSGYTNWELSADRANAARRVLEPAGIDPARIAAVRGLADRDLRNAANPRDPANRRISILLPFSSPPQDGAEAPPAAPERAPDATRG
jgi:chemotaxis protein MotB